MRTLSRVFLATIVLGVFGICLSALVLIFNSKDVTDSLDKVQRLAVGGIALSLLLAVSGGVLSFILMKRNIERPIKLLTAAITRVTLGDLSQTVTVNSHDEIGDLANDFNNMARQLTNTYRSLQDATRIAQEDRAQLESSINGLRQGFVLTNAHGKVTLANAAVRKISHETHLAEPDELPHNKKHHAEILDELSSLLPDNLSLAKLIEETIEHQKQSKFPSLPMGGRYINLYLSPVMSKGQAIGCVLLLEDVTEERILQRSRDEFFSIASHELRTPLTAIRGNASLIQKYYPDVMKDAQIGPIINDINESSMRLIEIVNDFLDMSRLEQNKIVFKPETFTVDPVIEKVIYEMTSLSREKGVALSFKHLTLGKLPAVYADQSRTKQVLYNLIGNALKFTEKGSVNIECVIEKKYLKVCVTDTGPGISPEAKQLLFRKFQQGTADILARDNTRGTGLGLYISKLLIDHMGGEVKLEHSDIGKGTMFSFTLPLATEENIKFVDTTLRNVSKAELLNQVQPSATK